MSTPGGGKGSVYLDLETVLASGGVDEDDDAVSKDESSTLNDESGLRPSKSNGEAPQPVEPPATAARLNINGDDFSPKSQGAGSAKALGAMSMIRGAKDQHDESLWLSRVKNKTDELRALFELPETENLRDEYHCALHKRILLQGRLYVFQHYLCFYSFILGYVKKKVIPLESVINVRKKRNVGFPNSIEVLWAGGKKEFFTSFLSRDDAYRNILVAWNEASPMARLANEAVQRLQLSPGDNRSEHDDEDDDAAGLTTARLRTFVGASTKNLSRRVESVVEKLQATSKKTVGQLVGAEGGAAGTGAPNSRQPSSTAAPGGSANLPPHTRLPTVYSGGTADEQQQQQHEGDEYEEEGEGGAGVGVIDRRSSSTDYAPRAADDGMSDQDSDLGEEDGLLGQLYSQDTEATPRAEHMQQVLCADLPDIPVRQFIRLVVSGSSDFFPRFHAARGDKEVALGAWGMNPGMGCVRELQFVSPLKYRIGPSEARCYQTQRYCLHRGEHLVFETSQVIPEIPYGDHFSVECRWDVSPSTAAMAGGTAAAGAAAGGCHIECYVHVSFSKQTIWRRTIERSVMDQSLESYKEILSRIQKEALEAGSSLSSGPSLRRGGAGGGASDSADGSGPLAVGMGPTTTASGGRGATAAGTAGQLTEGGGTHSPAASTGRRSEGGGQHSPAAAASRAAAAEGGPRRLASAPETATGGGGPGNGAGGGGVGDGAPAPTTASSPSSSKAPAAAGGRSQVQFGHAQQPEQQQPHGGRALLQHRGGGGGGGGGAGGSGWVPSQLVRALGTLLGDRAGMFMVLAMFWGVVVLYMLLQILRLVSVPGKLVLSVGGGAGPGAGHLPGQGGGAAGGGSAELAPVTWEHVAYLQRSLSELRADYDRIAALLNTLGWEVGPPGGMAANQQGPPHMPPPTPAP